MTLCSQRSKPVSSLPHYLVSVTFWLKIEVVAAGYTFWKLICRGNMAASMQNAYNVIDTHKM